MPPTVQTSGLGQDRHTGDRDDTPLMLEGGHVEEGAVLDEEEVKHREALRRERMSIVVHDQSHAEDMPFVNPMLLEDLSSPGSASSRLSHAGSTVSKASVAGTGAVTAPSLPAIDEKDVEK